MKRLIFLIMAFLPLMAFSQLSSGVYNIVKHSSIVNGESMFETDKMLGTSFFMVDIQNSSITFTASDYVVAIYNIKETINSGKSTIYMCEDRKTGNSFNIMYSPHETIKDAGDLLIQQSKEWADFFKILKIEK